MSYYHILSHQIHNKYLHYQIYQVREHMVLYLKHCINKLDNYMPLKFFQQLVSIKYLSLKNKYLYFINHLQIAILRQCNDQHIVKYYGSYFKDNNLWIVMEYCMAGSITDIVNITQIQLNQNEIASILQSVLKGLKYLHDKKKIHRDIKAANILLDQNGNAKLADFGVSTQMMYTNARHQTHIGSPYWMSPEVMQYSSYNQKTDIWSLGVTAIELAQGVVPYSHLKPFMAMWTMKDKPIQGFKQPQKWSAQFNDFVKKCLQISPQSRPQAQQLLNHQFIHKYSRGKRLLAELVRNSMGDIQNFRAGQRIKQQRDKNESEQILFNKVDSNGSEYETKTVIVKNSDKKNSQGMDSVIEHSSHSKSFKKNESSASSNNKLLQYEDEDCGSVIIKDQNNKGNHSRNCSQISVSSVLVKNQQGSQQKSKQNNNFFKSYIQNMQVMHSKQQQFKQSVKQRIKQIEQNFINTILNEYDKVKKELKQFIIQDELKNKQNKQRATNFESKLYESGSVLQYLYGNDKFIEERQKLEQQYKQKYLSNIQPVQNNYISMMLQSGNQQNSGEYQEVNNMMEYIDGDQDKVYLKQSLEMKNQYRKKSQSSADSPTSLFNNRKKNIKKLIIQQNLQQPNQLIKDNNSINTEGHNRLSKQKNYKQASFNKFLQKTPSIRNSTKHNNYKQIFINSANFNATTKQKSLLMSSTNYPHSNTTNMRGQKRVITTQPHQAYQYENDSLSTLTKLHSRNLKQFYQDPVVMNNLKQLTQQSQDYSPTVLNPFELKKNSFSKQIKSVKSKQKDKDKITIMRQKQRATHIAHIAMAHNNKDRTITNSNKKLKVIKVIQERQITPQDFNNQSTKTAKAKKSKSKNKQTASTTIPFGSVGNMGALQFLPSKIGKSKEKKATQIPVKSGPFSKIKSKN